MAYTGKVEFAPDFIQNLSKGAGYSLNSACAELIDNGKGAFANLIKLTIRNGRFKYEDYGDDAGMDENTLIKKYFYGGNSGTINSVSAPGMFGIGGKTGLISLIGNIDCDVEIITHKKGHKPISATWKIRRGSSDIYEYDFLNDDSIPYGTTIEFKYDTNINVESLKNFISVVYCWEIQSGTKIYVNDTLICPNDPLYRNNETVVKDKLFTTKKFKVNGEIVTVNVVKFTNSNIISEEELHSWDKGENKKKTVCTANRSGLYTKTSNRYYTLGDNFDSLIGGTVHASMNGLRIEVDIPKSLWPLIGMTWNKGKELISFSKIPAFNTGDKDTGVVDYIKYVMGEFKNHDEKKKHKFAKTINSVVEEIVKGYNIDFIKICVLSSNATNVCEFVSYKNNVLTIDVSQTTKCKDELKGLIEALSVSVNFLAKEGNKFMIDNIINQINQ